MLHLTRKTITQMEQQFHNSSNPGCHYLWVQMKVNTQITWKEIIISPFLPASIIQFIVVICKDNTNILKRKVCICHNIHRMHNLKTSHINKKLLRNISNRPHTEKKTSNLTEGARVRTVNTTHEAFNPPECNVSNSVENIYRSDRCKNTQHK